MSQTTLFEERAEEITEKEFKKIKWFISKEDQKNLVKERYHKWL